MRVLKSSVSQLICLFLVLTGSLSAAAHRSTIKIDKSQHELTLYVDGEKQQSYRVSTGANNADKTRSGDMTTPEGVFEIVQIEPAHEWDHVFADAAHAGAVRCYGPYFLRLSTKAHETFSRKGPWEGIGIHGSLEKDLYSTDKTHLVAGPGTLGTSASEGCVRMANSDLVDLMNRISQVDRSLLGTRVIIVDGKTRI
jgi:lipoprotein-anchoring transpeptidase ErfK/SrfK